MLWLGFAHLADYLLYASLFGGALTVLIIQFRAVPLPKAFVGREWAERLHRRDGGVPYGIALAAAALLIYPHTEWMTGRALRVRSRLVTVTRCRIVFKVGFGS